MDSVDYSNALELLRQGLPPQGLSSHLTVGNASRIQELESLIHCNGPHLIGASLGCGKSHVLEHIREKALEQEFVTSLVRVDSERETRFNCFDQILGGIFRGLQIPGKTHTIGIHPFLDAICQIIEDSRFETTNNDFWFRLSNNWTWDQDTHKVLESPSLYIALRAWFFGEDTEKSLVDNWLGYPWRYYKDRKNIVRTLVEGLSSHFLDPRSPSVLFSNKTRLFHFKEPGYQQSWGALRDINRLAKFAGFRGLILLFDNMDDIHERLGNLKLQKLALANLFRFLNPQYFDGKSFFAVDEDFEGKCRDEFIKKRQGDYDLSEFSEIPRFRLGSLQEEDILSLALKISLLHQRAYEWSINSEETKLDTRRILQHIGQTSNEYSPRLAVRSIMENLDERLESIR